jgi:DNA invertase Pin-like site-specific DNA recombinase
MKKLYNAGLYVRLSVEDAANSQKRGKGNPFQHESASVENQKAILREYAHLRGWNIFQTYADDGFSGGNYERPAFNEMIEDAKAGLINLILVKDLSRLGRDYIETGRYTEEVLPSLGVRFVALMDDIDSEGTADFLPFRSLLNDYHLKDLSRKIKTVLRAKAENGGYVGAFAPYGFMKNPSNPGRLAVDDYAAEVVQRIFKMRVQGMSYTKIAAALNRDGILAPRDYCYQREGKPNPYNEHNVWQSVTVRVLLKNEAYLGHSVKFKKGTASYKNKHLINRPKEDWVRCENTHPTIISNETWDAAQSISANHKSLQPKRGNTPTPKPLFAGILKCADCGGGLIYTTKKQTRKTGRVVGYVAYSCCLYSHTGRTKCSPHSISQLTLLEIVRQDIRHHLEQINTDERRVVKEIQSRLSETSLEDAKQGLSRLTARLSELETLGAQLYEDRLNGTINLDTFKSLSAAAEDERTIKQDERDKLARLVAEFEQQTLNVQNWLGSIRSFLSLENPSNETLFELIERLDVGENEGTRKQKRQSIRISYRFVGYVG